MCHTNVFGFFCMYDLNMTLKWHWNCQQWPHMTLEHDFIYSTRFIIPENGIKHVSHSYNLIRCIHNAKSPHKWRPFWIFASRDFSTGGIFGDFMFLRIQDVRQEFLKKSAFYIFFHVRGVFNLMLLGYCLE